MVSIGFEACGYYITARDGENVLIRCNSSYTDLRDSESLDSFVLRHGGPTDTAAYLNHAYREAR